MSSHLNLLCTDMNSIVPVSFPGGNDNPYTSYTLRLIFFSCFIGCKVLFKNIKSFEKGWKKVGGSIKNQYGGVYAAAVESELNSAFRMIIGLDGLGVCYDSQSLQGIESLSDVSVLSTTEQSTSNNTVINEIQGEGNDLYIKIERQNAANISQIKLSLEIMRKLRHSPLREDRISILINELAEEEEKQLQPQMKTQTQPAVMARDNVECPINACDTSSGSYLYELAKECCPIMFKTKTAGNNLKNKGKNNNKTRKLKKNKYRKTKKNTKKSRRIKKGGVKTKEQIQKEMMKGATPMTSVELNRLAEADRIAEERERNDNEIRRINADLERQRINTIMSFPSTPMSPEDARRQNREDELHNKRVNSEAAKSRKLTIADLGGSRNKKSRKSRKIRGGNRIGGNNIGANCSDPNFSIYNTNLLKLFPYKGGNLQSDDPYKNSEGPQY